MLEVYGLCAVSTWPQLPYYICNVPCCAWESHTCLWHTERAPGPTHIQLLYGGTRTGPQNTCYKPMSSGMVHCGFESVIKLTMPATNQWLTIVVHTGLCATTEYLVLVTLLNQLMRPLPQVPPSILIVQVPSNSDYHYW
jgi:hypothetical protein